jgi:hypothetical protein
MTDEEKIIAFFTFYNFLSVNKKHILGKQKIQIFWSETNTFQAILQINEPLKLKFRNLGFLTISTKWTLERFCMGKIQTQKLIRP